MDQCPLCEKGPPKQLGRHPTLDMDLVGCSRCGEFFVDAVALHPLTQLSFNERCNISAVTRAAWDAGRRLEIRIEDFQRLIDSAPTWDSPFDGVDRLLLLMMSRTDDWLVPIKIDMEDDYPLLCARGRRECDQLLDLAWQTGYLVPNTTLFTVEGLRRLDELRERQPDSRQAFVAMSFAEEMHPIWENGFKPGIEDTNYYRAFRVDLAEYNEKIDDHIIAELRRSGLVVADFTENRGGVYFEAGFGLGLDIPLIFTCRSDCIDEVHFDTRQYNHIVWETPEILRERLSDRIAATALPKGWRAV